MKKIISAWSIGLLLAFTSGCGGSEAGNQSSGSPDLGVALYSFNRFAFPETLEKSKEAGVGIVEGFFFHSLGEEFEGKRLADLSDSQLEVLKAQIEQSDLHYKSLYAGGKTLEEWSALFERGKMLGAEFLVGEPEPELWDGINKMAGENGMKMAIHQHAKGKSRFWHPDSVLVAIGDRENFGACGDLGHWVRSGLDPVECLKILEGHLISIHAKDLDEFGNGEANDVKVGTGVIDYPAVMKELKRQEFSGPIYIECEHDWENNLEDVKYAVEYIKGLK